MVMGEKAHLSWLATRLSGRAAQMHTADSTSLLAVVAGAPPRREGRVKVHISKLHRRVETNSTSLLGDSSTANIEQICGACYGANEMLVHALFQAEAMQAAAEKGHEAYTLVVKYTPPLMLRITQLAKDVDKLKTEVYRQLNATTASMNDADPDGAHLDAVTLEVKISELADKRAELKAESAKLNATGTLQEAQQAYDEVKQLAHVASDAVQEARDSKERACDSMHGALFESEWCGATDGAFVLYTGDGTSCTEMCAEANLSCVSHSREIQSAKCITSLVQWYEGDTAECAELAPGIWMGNPMIHDPTGTGEHSKACSFRSTARSASQACDAKHGDLDARFCSCNVVAVVPPSRPTA